MSVGTFTAPDGRKLTVYRSEYDMPGDGMNPGPVMLGEPTYYIDGAQVTQLEARAFVQSIASRIRVHPDNTIEAVNTLPPT